MGKVFENKAIDDDKRIAGLETKLKQQMQLMKKFLRNLFNVNKILKRLKKEQIKTLTAKLKQAEARAEFADKSVQKLQKEVDRLEDELVAEQENFKGITEELEQTFAEMSGY